MEQSGRKRRQPKTFYGGGEHGYVDYPTFTGVAPEGRCRELHTVRVLMVGATGPNAGLVLPALLERGVEVRALVRNADGARRSRRRREEVRVLERLLCLCTPAGQDEFFRAVGVPVASRTAPPPVLDDAATAAFIARAVALAPRYRTELLLPGHT
jgi:hypothetical protein